jgi:DNA-binding transcriptional LysR family regulator
MDTNRLRYFCVVTRTGSLRQAATLLRLSSPALSKAMRLLEEEIGFPLLVPVGRGIAVTDQGRKLAEAAEPLLRSLDDLAAGRISAGKDTERLRIGSFEVFTTYFLGRVAQEVFPDRALDVHELLPGALESALEASEIDLGITYLPIPSAGLEHMKVCDIEMGIFGSKEPEGALTDWPFAVPLAPRSSTPTKAQGIDGWPDDRIPRLQAYRVGMMETALDLCRRGLAVAYLPSFVVELHNRTQVAAARLRKFAPPRGLGQQLQSVYLVRRKTSAEDANVKKLAKALRLFCKV